MASSANREQMPVLEKLEGEKRDVLGEAAARAMDAWLAGLHDPSAAAPGEDDDSKQCTMRRWEECQWLR